MENLYDILEVSQKASKEVIEKAYKTLAKKYHPDLQTDGSKQLAEEKMKKINDAYSVLMDDTKREEYDRELQLKSQREVQEKIAREVQNNYQQAQSNHENQQEQQYYQSDQNENYDEQFSWLDYYNRLTGREQRRIRKKIEREAKEDYRSLYENYFRSLGYKVPHKWTWREVKILLIIITVVIVLFMILWAVPASRMWMVNLYDSNVLVKIVVNIFIGIINGIKEFFKLIFGRGPSI